MAKLYCLSCQKESNSREDLQCPHCGARGKWGHPTEDSEDGPKKCACGKADSGFCPVCNRECPACHSKMYNGVCVYCDGKDYSHM